MFPMALLQILKISRPSWLIERSLGQQRPTSPLGQQRCTTIQRQDQVTQLLIVNPRKIFFLSFPLFFWHFFSSIKDIQ